MGHCGEEDGSGIDSTTHLSRYSRICGEANAPDWLARSTALEAWYTGGECYHNTAEIWRNYSNRQPSINQPSRIFFDLVIH